MKCIKNKQTGVVRRTYDATAVKLVASGRYDYAPKSEWKQNNPIPRKESIESSKQEQVVTN